MPHLPPACAGGLTAGLSYPVHFITSINEHTAARLGSSSISESSFIQKKKSATFSSISWCYLRLPGHKPGCVVSFLPSLPCFQVIMNLFFPKRVVFLPCRWFFPVLVNLIMQNPVGCLYWVTDGGLSLSPLELSHCQPGWQQGQLVLQSESHSVCL